MQSPIHTTGVRNALQYTKKSRHVIKNTEPFNDFSHKNPFYALKNSQKWSAGKEKKLR
jgi:hypothetical protein